MQNEHFKKTIRKFLSHPMITNHDLIDMSEELNMPKVEILFKDQLIGENPLDPKKLNYIINLNDSVDLNGVPNAGTHWVALFFDPLNQESYYFDSFGFPPPIAVKQFIKFKWDKLGSTDKVKNTYNRKQIQSMKTGFCGSYCLMFLYIMNKMEDKKDAFERFIKIFN